MDKTKKSQQRERELLAERARLIVEHIRNTPDILRDVQGAHEAEKRGEGVLARAYVESHGGEQV